MACRLFTIPRHRRLADCRLNAAGRRAPSETEAWTPAQGLLSKSPTSDHGAGT